MTRQQMRVEEEEEEEDLVAVVVVGSPRERRFFLNQLYPGPSAPMLRLPLPLGSLNVYQ